MGEISSLLFPQQSTNFSLDWSKRIKNSICGTPLFSSSYYSTSNLKVILRAKENNDSRARMVLARAIALHIEEPCILIPIPSSAAANRRRGYDHSALLAQEVSKLTNGSVWQALRVNRRVADQTKLNHQDRFTNLAGAYSFIPGNYSAGGIVPFNKLVLVDDLVTTGASIAQAIKVLEGAELTLNRAISACIATHHLPNTIST
jgi:predicted amidophosphoribosyltransferase